MQVAPETIQALSHRRWFLFSTSDYSPSQYVFARLSLQSEYCHGEPGELSMQRYGILKDELSRKLYLSRSAGRVNVHKRGLYGVAAADATSRRVTEVSVVERIKELGADLDTLRIRYPKCFHYCKVRIRIGRIAIPIANCLAEGVIRWRNETTGVVPSLDTLFEAVTVQLTT